MVFTDKPANKALLERMITYKHITGLHPHEDSYGMNSDGVYMYQYNKMSSVFTSSTEESLKRQLIDIETKYYDKCHLYLRAGLFSFTLNQPPEFPHTREETNHFISYWSGLYDFIKVIYLVHEYTLYKEYLRLYYIITVRKESDVLANILHENRLLNPDIIEYIRYFQEPERETLQKALTLFPEYYSKKEIHLNFPNKNRFY